MTVKFLILSASAEEHKTETALCMINHNPINPTKWGKGWLIYNWKLYSQIEAWNLSWQFLFCFCIQVHPCALPHEYSVVESSLSLGALGEEDINRRKHSDHIVLWWLGLVTRYTKKRGMVYHVVLLYYTLPKSASPSVIAVWLQVSMERY